MSQNKGFHSILWPFLPWVLIPVDHSPLTPCLLVSCWVWSVGNRDVSPLPFPTCGSVSLCASHIWQHCPLLARLYRPCASGFWPLPVPGLPTVSLPTPLKVVQNFQSSSWECFLFLPGIVMNSRKSNNNNQLLRNNCVLYSYVLYDILNHLILKTLWSKYCYWHLTDKETEAQRMSVTLLWHMWLKTGMLLVIVLHFIINLRLILPLKCIVPFSLHDVFFSPK